MNISEGKLCKNTTEQKKKKYGFETKSEVQWLQAYFQRTLPFIKNGLWTTGLAAKLSNVQFTEHKAITKPNPACGSQ